MALLTSSQDPNTGRYEMGGPLRCLVRKPSATSCLPPDTSPNHSIAISRTHSDLVKFAHHDSEYDKVAYILRQIHERPVSHRADEKHYQCVQNLQATDPTVPRRDCLRSLAFPQMQSRFHDIDRATTGTCGWVLTHE